MVGTTKVSTTSKRHGMLMDSSSRQFDSRSKQDRDANPRGTFGSQNSTNSSTRLGNTHTVQGTAGVVPNRQDAGKLTVLSSVPSITPQVSPRLRRKDYPEKENIKVEGPPLRQTISRSATCNTLLRKPVSNANSGAISDKIKTPHSLPRSESSRPSKLPRSPNSRLHLQALTSSHERAMKRSQTTISLGAKVKVKDNVPAVEQQDLSGKRQQGNTTVKGQSTSTQEDNSSDPAEPAVYFDCVPTSDLSDGACGSPKTPITPSAPRSASIPRTVSSFSRSKSLKTTKLLGVSDSTESTDAVPKSPHLKTYSAGKPGAVLKIPVSPSPLGNVLYSSTDGGVKKMDWDTTEALEDEPRFELVDLGAVFQQVKAELKQASPASSTNAGDCTDANLEELSTVAVSGTTADVCDASLLDEIKASQEMPAVNDTELDEKPKAHKEPESGSDGPGHTEARPSQETLGLPSESSDCSSCFAESIHSDAMITSAPITDSNELIDANAEVASTPKSSTSKSPPNAPSAPPSTPIRSSPSASVSQQPSTLFPRLFTELASSYAQFGFSNNPNLGFGFGSATKSTAAGMGKNDQTVRTQRELASLRAGTGSVLTRARLFGQTIWSPSRTHRSDDPEVRPKPAEQENSGNIHPGEASGSVAVTPPSSPSRNTTNSPPLPTDTSTATTPIKCSDGKRTLGCANALQAVAMTQQLWKTKNFLLE